MSRVLLFKATKKGLKYYNSDETGLVKDGEIVDVEDGLAQKLLEWYPENFTDLEGQVESSNAEQGVGKTKEVREKKPKRQKTK